MVVKQLYYLSTLCFRHLETLENTVATDVRLILALLRQQGMKTVGSMPDSREV